MTYICMRLDFSLRLPPGPDASWSRCNLDNLAHGPELGLTLRLSTLSPVPPLPSPLAAAAAAAAEKPLTWSGVSLPMCLARPWQR